MKIRFKILKIIIILLMLFILALINSRNISFCANDMEAKYSMIMGSIYNCFDYRFIEETELDGEKTDDWKLENLNARDNFQKQEYIQIFINGQISSGQINDLQSFYNKYSSNKNAFLNRDDVHKYFKQKYSGKISDEARVLYDDVMSIVEGVLYDKKRDVKFNEINKYLDSINTSNYSSSMISQLEEYYQEVEQNYGKSYYNDSRIKALQGAYVNTAGINANSGYDCSKVLLEKIKQKGEEMSNTKGAISININTNEYDPSKDTTDYNAGKGLIKQKVGKILGFIRNLSVVVSVITLMVIGVKYILGSVEEKAQYKQTLYPWFIGILLVIGGTTLISFIYNSVI